MRLHTTLKMWLPAVALAAAALVALSLAAPARAETQETDAITLGSMVERADFVGLAQAVEPASEDLAWTLRVVERWRGGDGPLEVTLRTGPEGLRRDAVYLVLAATPGTNDVLTPLSSTYAVRNTGADGVAPLVAYARKYADTFDEAGELTDAARLRAHLVLSLSSRDSGVPFSAGRDLLRREDLHAGLTDEQRAEITAAITLPGKPDQDLASILLAGALGDAGADAALLARLLDPATRHMRRHVTRSLALRATPQLVQTLVDEIDGATPEQRADLANALGRVERSDALAPLLAFLRDASGEVRVEALHSLGLLARAVRRAPHDDDAVALDPAAERPKLDAAREPLRTAVNSARSTNERKAAVWALAQIDTPESWALLRDMASEHANADVRRFATRYLSTPRVGLLFSD